MLNIDNPYFGQTVGHIYHTVLLLNRVNSFDTKAHILDMDLATTNDIVPSQN